jgi:hypothetical protein
MKQGKIKKREMCTEKTKRKIGSERIIYAEGESRG